MADLQYVKGLEGILDTLKALPPEIVSKSGGPVRFAARKASVIFQKAAQANIDAIVAEPNKDGRPSDSTGTLKAAVIVSRRKPRPGFKGEIFSTRVKRGAKNRDGVTANKYGGILEFGDEQIPAKAWLRRAFEENKQRALAEFTTSLKKGIESAVRRARKKGIIA